MPRPNCSVNMEDFFNKYYLPKARHRKRSWEVDIRLYRKYIAPVFGQKSLAEIKSRKIENWLIGLAQKGLQANTCNRVLAILKAICSSAVLGNWITTSPCVAVSPLKDLPRQERFLTREEAIRLKTRLEQENTPASRVLLLLLLTGARKSEILKAKWENVDLEKQILTVPISKSGKSRYISLSSQVCEIISAMRANASQQGSQWLFPGRNRNRPLKNIQASWQKIRAELGLGSVRIHDLRHSFASFMAAQGHSIYEVQIMLGHADPRTSMRYAHLRQEQLLQAAENVSQLICGWDEMVDASGSEDAGAAIGKRSDRQDADPCLSSEENMDSGPDLAGIRHLPAPAASSAGASGYDNAKSQGRERSPLAWPQAQARSLDEGLVMDVVETAIKAAFEQVFRQFEHQRSG